MVFCVKNNSVFFHSLSLFMKIREIVSEEFHSRYWITVL